MEVVGIRLRGEGLCGEDGAHFIERLEYMVPLEIHHAWILCTKKSNVDPMLRHMGYAAYSMLPIVIFSLLCDPIIVLPPDG